LKTPENDTASTNASEGFSDDSGFDFLSRITLDSQDFGGRVRNVELEASEHASGNQHESSKSVSDSDEESLAFFDAEE
jgi:hypothetical protein